MTTIILTSMSFMPAALMIFFYGGQMFHGGRDAAMADAYMNAGHNAIAASDHFRLDNRYDPPDFSSLVEAGLLKGSPFAGRTIISSTGGAGRVTISVVDVVVCAKINETLKRPVAEWCAPAANANAGDGDMGCRLVDGDGVFYAVT